MNNEEENLEKIDNSLGRVYKNRSNISPIIKYFYSCRPDLKDKLLVPQADMLKDLIDLHYNYHAISCGRGFGKTMSAGCVGLYFADEYSTKIGKPLTVLVISSQEALYRNVGTFFEMNPSLRPRLKVQPVGPRELPASGAFQFVDNHSMFIHRLATIKAVEGIRADVIIVDETQDIDTSVILKGLGCLKTDILGIVIFIGTPFTENKGKVGKVNWFIELVKNPKKFIEGKPFHLSQYPSNLCSWNDVSLWKAAWGPVRFDAECLGIVTPVEDKPTFNNVEACCYDIDGVPEGGVNSRREAGIDCGEGRTTYILTERIGTVKRKVLYIEIWEDKHIQDIAPEIAGLINLHNPSLTKIDSKQGKFAPSYKREIKKYTQKLMVAVDASLKDKVLTSTGEENLMTIKANMMGQLIKKIREGNLIIPMRIKYADLLVKELKIYNPKKGRNDDLVDALALSCYEPSVPFNSGTGGRVYANWV